jgi:chromosome segregation ATPase
MFLLVFNLSTIEIISLLTGAIIFGFAVHFFIVYRRSLHEALQKKVDQPIHIMYDTKPAPKKKPEPAPRRERLPELKKPVVHQEPEIKRERVVEREVFRKKEEPVRDESIHSLRSVISQQQQMLNALMEKAEGLQHTKLSEENEDLAQQIGDLENKLAGKEEELRTLRQQATAAEKMAERIEEVYKEFDAFQERIIDLESQAGQATQLAMDLEDMKDGYESLRKDLVRKQTRLEETVAENQRLHQQLNEVEDKLAEANLQRQQLHKKVQFLQELNNDMQSMSDTNKKLQTEMRRIGELESMLNMIAEERDHLLRKQFSK